MITSGIWSQQHDPRLKHGVSQLKCRLLQHIGHKLLAPPQSPSTLQNALRQNTANDSLARIHSEFSEILKQTGPLQNTVHKSDEELSCVYKLCGFDQLGKEQGVNMESVFQGSQSRKAAFYDGVNVLQMLMTWLHYLFWE